MATIDRLMAFENDELEHDEVISLFQELVDTGMAWELQGFYGRTAKHLIDIGSIRAPQNKGNKNAKYQSR